MMSLQIIIVMGVSGSGKSTVANALHLHLLQRNYPSQVIDADDLHPPENIIKMKNFIPLTDIDRQPWLQACKNMIDRWLNNPSKKFVGILACSALKRK
jgi:gluconokinase